MLNSSISKAPDIDRAQRRRTLKKAYIYADTTGGNKPCVLKNISETGVLLQFDNTHNIPGEFMIGIELDGTETPAKWVRQQGEFIGAQFTGDTNKVQQLRSQVISSFDTRALEKEPINILKKKTC